MTRTTVRVVARVRARALPRCRLPGGARGARCHRPPCVRADRRLCAGTHDCLVSRRRGSPERTLSVSRLVPRRGDATSTQLVSSNPIN